MRIWVVLFITLCVRLNGQVNLVPNPSFELYDTCPNSTNDLENAVPWFQPNNPGVWWYGSSDFMHSCAAMTVGTPSNVWGFQVPRTGQGYAGFAPYSDPSDLDGREYIEVKLDSQLIANRLYCFSFYLVLSNAPGVCTATSAIGVFLSSDTCQYVSANYTTLNVQPQLINEPSNIIVDSINWTEVKLLYEAQGGERYMTIGNFWGATYNLPNTMDLCANSGGPTYYLLDDVSVVMLPELNAGPNDTLLQGDTVTLNGGISENWNGMQFEWLPHEGLVDPYSLTTSSHPDSTTTYVLSVTCPTCDVICLDEVRDSVTLFVSPQPTLPPFRVPTLFTNDQLFQIENLQPNSRLKLYDVQGRLVYWSDNYSNNFALTNLSAALYNYEIELADSRKFTGKFVVVER